MSTCVILPVFYLIKLEGERDGSIFGALRLFCTLIKFLLLSWWCSISLYHSLLGETSVVGEILVRTERIGLLESFSR